MPGRGDVASRRRPPTGTGCASNHRHEPTPSATRGERLIVAATVTVGTGLMVIVGLDGSPVGQLLRLAAVAAMITATYGALRRGALRLRAAVAFTIGLFGLAIGAGIGLPHLAKSGLHVLTVDGLFSVVGGLVLLTWGGGRLVRATRPLRRCVVVPALLAAVFAVTWSVGQAVAATNVPPTSVGDTTPADIGLRYHDVEFETADRVILSGPADSASSAGPHAAPRSLGSPGRLTSAATTTGQRPTLVAGQGNTKSLIGERQGPIVPIQRGVTAQTALVGPCCSSQSRGRGHRRGGRRGRRPCALAGAPHTSTSCGRSPPSEDERLPPP